METLKSLFHTIAYSIPNIGFTDILDILVVTVVIYYLIGKLRATNAFRVVKGIFVILIVTFLTGIFQLNSVNFVLNKILELGFIALVIVFQPELRRLLEKVGSKRISEILGSRDKRTETETTIESVVNACEILSRDRIGALIVFERDTLLGNYLKSGTVLDAEVSSQLLRSIFYPKTALHDGAVILRQGKVAAAGCVLPLTENNHISSELGTRHRAGIGMSEASDAIVVIVSEETGTISLAKGGMLKRHLSPPMLEKSLRSDLLKDENAQDLTLRQRLKNFLKQEDDGHAEK